MASDTNLALGLIADDLTGASDSAVQFARRGWKTLLVLGSTVPLKRAAVGLSAVARSKHASFGETRRSLGEGGKPDTTTKCLQSRPMRVPSITRAPKSLLLMRSRDLSKPASIAFI